MSVVCSVSEKGVQCVIDELGVRRMVGISCVGCCVNVLGMA